MSNKNKPFFTKQNNNPINNVIEKSQEPIKKIIENDQEPIQNVLEESNNVLELDLQENSTVIIENKTVIGHVDNCEKLHLRSQASKESESLCKLNKGDEIQILDESNEFYKVCTGSGLEGYCMKAYIVKD